MSTSMIELSRSLCDIFDSLDRGVLFLDESGNCIKANSRYTSCFESDSGDQKVELQQRIAINPDDAGFYASIPRKHNKRQKICGSRLFIEHGMPFRYNGRNYGLVFLEPCNPVNKELINLIDEAVLLCDRKGCIISVSLRFHKIFQEPFSRCFSGVSIAELLDTNSLKIYAQRFSQLLEEGELHDLALDIIRKDGQVVKGLVSARVLNEEPSVILIVFRDMTEQLRPHDVLLEESLLNAVIARLSGSILTEGSSFPDFSRLFMNEILLMTGCAGGFISETDPASLDIFFHVITGDLQKAKIVQLDTGRFYISRNSLVTREFLDLFLYKPEGFFTNTPDYGSPLRFLLDEKDYALCNYMVMPLNYQEKTTGQLFLYSRQSRQITERDFEMIKSLAGIYMLAELKFRRQLQMQDVLEKQEHSVGTAEALLAAVHQDIHNPLSRMTFIASQLESPEIPLAQKQALLVDLRDIKDQLSRIISSARNIAAIESGFFEHGYSEFDYNALLERIRRDHLQKAAKRNLSIKVEYSRTLSRLFRGDGMRTRQIITGLLNFCLEHASDTVLNLIVRERKRYNNTIELEHLFDLQDSGFKVKFSPVSGNLNEAAGFQNGFGWGVELAATMALIDKARGSIDIDIDNQSVDQVRLLLPLFCAG